VPVTLLTLTSAGQKICGACGTGVGAGGGGPPQAMANTNPRATAHGRSGRPCEAIIITLKLYR
jgi:hypothetical protein